MRRENVLVRFDALPAIERERATKRFTDYREELKRIGYLHGTTAYKSTGSRSLHIRPDNREDDSDPMIRAAHLATIAVALGGSWSDVFQAIEDQMDRAEDHATRGAAESLALLWMGASLDVP